MRRGLRPCLWLPWLLLCSGLAVAAPADGLRLQVDESELDAAHATASRELLQATLARLPSRWTQALGPLSLRWRDDLPEGVHGRARQGVQLRRQLLDDFIASDASADDVAAAPTRAVQAALIHELAHFYLRTPKGRLQADSRLLDLAGWPASPFRFGGRGGRNDFRDRGPDRYELESPDEFVAVNLEHFLLDPDYACRRPALYRYFAAHFAVQPAHPECTSTLAFVESPTAATDAPLLSLDPARVYAVEYLLAEGNAQPLSRWGHSMLRLVICAPGRVPGPECRLDLEYHRVLSFRAFVDDVQISSWRGLTGDYPSRLFMLPLSQVVEEYTQVQLRGLHSLPLRLSREEIAALLERAARVHWSYDGRYYFVSNNCAVETWRLLHDGVPRLAAAPLRSITPNGLLRRLQREGIADDSVLGDEERARRQGYRFEAADSYYQDMLDAARGELALPQSRAVDWLDLLPEQRAPWLTQAGLRGSAALLVLEQAALRRQQALARDELKRRLLDRDGDAGPAAEALQALLAEEAALSRPAGLIAEGYGLPQADEIARAMTQAGARRGQADVLREELLRQAHAALSPVRQRALDAIDANLAALSVRLRELAAEESGSGSPP
ncbi:hypothetical protein CSC70_12880 [Pseudoxanthomonas kalamensis DSM 18571]|uniref:DUF7844 domain-containing protein n=1 Tax=Pseudoxanthomonas kalamensis TaxID=289483 RepID=UPI001391E53E|nr:DUF4105 domain-containing protein [Pseudoxanthomonas kalamensis]KAF1708536.1 hypothetical protein CSC70_12880 [Pseudoxanthomonas kalamensis DSM 18571]